MRVDDGGPVAQSPKQQGTAEARPTPLAEATGVVPADAGAGASAAVSPVRQRRPAGGAAPSERTPPAATSDPYGGKVSERSGSPAQRPSAAGALPPASQTPVGFAARSLAPFYVPGEGGRGRGKPLPEQGLPGKLVSDVVPVSEAAAHPTRLPLAAPHRTTFSRCGAPGQGRSSHPFPQARPP